MKYITIGGIFTKMIPTITSQISLVDIYDTMHKLGKSLKSQGDVRKLSSKPTDPLHFLNGSVTVDDKTISEIGDIIYKAFVDTNNLDELDALCFFVEENLPYKDRICYSCKYHRLVFGSEGEWLWCDCPSDSPLAKHEDSCPESLPDILKDCPCFLPVQYEEILRR